MDDKLPLEETLTAEELRTLEVVTRDFEDSRQPRHHNPEEFLREIMTLVDTTLDEPVYQSDTRYRDRWLLSFARRENHLTGVLNTVVQIDKNRRWRLVGSERQVMRFARILNNFAGNNKRSWQEFISTLAYAYYSTDIGYIAEIERTSSGAVSSMYNVDSSRCLLTGHPDFPLMYSQRSGRSNFFQPGYLPAGKDSIYQFWESQEFMRSCSLPSVEEEMNGAGFSAISRCLTLAKIMIGTYAYQLDKLAAKPAKGYLMTSIPRRVFDQIDEDIRRIKQQGGHVVDGVYGMYGLRIDEMIKFVGLSEIPDHFEPEEFVDRLLKGFSLAFGYNVAEFYETKDAGGRRLGEEVIQTENVTSKGEMAFALSVQEDIQRQLPPSLRFIYETRNDQGALIRAEIDKMHAETAAILYNMRNPPGSPNEDEPVFTPLQMTEWLASKGVVPVEWADTITDVETTNVERIKHEFRDWLHVRHAAKLFPSEPIVIYEYPSQTVRVLAQDGWEVLQPRLY